MATILYSVHVGDGWNVIVNLGRRSEVLHFHGLMNEPAPAVLEDAINRVMDQQLDLLSEQVDAEIPTNTLENF